MLSASLNKTFFSLSLKFYKIVFCQRFNRIRVQCHHILIGACDLMSIPVSQSLAGADLEFYKGGGEE